MQKKHNELNFTDGITENTDDITLTVFLVIAKLYLDRFIKQLPARKYIFVKYNAVYNCTYIDQQVENLR